MFSLQKFCLVCLATAFLGSSSYSVEAEEQQVQSAGQDEHTHSSSAPARQNWTFSGPFGRYDQAQLQRGFQIYREVCAACHSMKLVAFRNLIQPGGPEFSEGQIKALAETYKISDGPNEAGEMFERPGRLSDYLPSPFPNDELTKAANGGALPPDMSVLAKARSYERGFPWFLLDLIVPYQEHGPDYIVGILTGYSDPPPGMVLPPTAHYNRIMPGHQIAMAPPLHEGQVAYTDGSPQTVQQYAHDVAAFLMWAAEPHLVARKRLGFNIFIFLIVLAGLLFLTKKKIWSNIRD